MPITLSPYALLTLEEGKSAIGAIEPFTQNADLTLYINGVSELIENVCGTNFVARSYDEVFDGDGTNRHRVYHTPVLSGTGLEYAIIATRGGSAVPTANIYLNAAQGIFYLVNDYFDEGFQNCSIHYHAGYVTIPWGVKDAASITLSRFWKLKDKGTEVVSSVTVEGQTTTFRVDAIPQEALVLLARYRRPRFA